MRASSAIERRGADFWCAWNPSSAGSLAVTLPPASLPSGVRGFAETLTGCADIVRGRQMRAVASGCCCSNSLSMRRILRQLWHTEIYVETQCRGATASMPTLSKYTRLISAQVDRVTLGHKLHSSSRKGKAYRMFSRLRRVFYPLQMTSSHRHAETPTLQFAFANFSSPTDDEFLHLTVSALAGLALPCDRRSHQQQTQRSFVAGRDMPRYLLIVTGFGKFRGEILC